MAPAFAPPQVELIDRFNVMLAGVARLADFRHVTYVDLRNTLSSSPANYKRFWANELHPTGDGFSLVAAKIAAAI